MPRCNRSCDFTVLAYYKRITFNALVSCAAERLAVGHGWRYFGADGVFTLLHVKGIHALFVTRHQRSGYFGDTPPL